MGSFGSAFGDQWAEPVIPRTPGRQLRKASTCSRTRSRALGGGGDQGAWGPPHPAARAQGWGHLTVHPPAASAAAAAAPMGDAGVRDTNTDACAKKAHCVARGYWGRASLPPAPSRPVRPTGEGPAGDDPFLQFFARPEPAQGRPFPPPGVGTCFFPLSDTIDQWNLYISQCPVIKPVG